MLVTRFFKEKLPNGTFAEQVDLGAKAVNVTTDANNYGDYNYGNAEVALTGLHTRLSTTEAGLKQEIEDRVRVVGDEKSAREASDKTITDSLNDEIDARKQADADAATALSNAIAKEVTDRNDAISDAIAKEVTNRNNAISDAIGDLADDLAQIETNTTDIYNLQKRVLLNTEQVITSEGAITLKEDVTNLHSMEIEISYNGNNVGYYSIKPGTTSLTFTSLSSTGFKNSSVTFATSESTLTVTPNASMSIDAEGTIAMQEGLLEDTEFKILNIYGYK